MSIQAVAWVLDHSRSRGLPRLVLISLANHANGTTGLCCPAMRTIAREAGVSLGTIPNAVANLVDLGELVVEEPGGPRRAARYVLPFAQRSGDEHGSVQDVNAARAPGVNAAFSPGVNRTRSNRSQPKDSAKAEPFSADFDAWWEDYPRKQHRKAALDAYRARRRQGIGPERLTLARDKYRVYVDGTEMQFILHGSTFLAVDGPWSEWEAHEPPSIEALIEPPAALHSVPTCPLDLCGGSGYVDVPGKPNTVSPCRCRRMAHA